MASIENTLEPILITTKKVIAALEYLLRSYWLLKIIILLLENAFRYFILSAT